MSRAIWTFPRRTDARYSPLNCVSFSVRLSAIAQNRPVSGLFGHKSGHKINDSTLTRMDVTGSLMADASDARNWASQRGLSDEYLSPVRSAKVNGQGRMGTNS